MLNKVVARFAEGPVVKGMTADFFPGKDVFHLSLADMPSDAEPIEVHMQDLKALFFVKDYQGDPAHVEQKQFDEGRPPAGRRIQVTFKDGEILVGSTTGYQPSRPGFFLVPVDPESNIERCYVVTAATKSVSFL